MLWYTGTIALPPVAIYGADRLSDDRYAQAAAYVIDRVTAIAATDSVAFRRQNGSDYVSCGIDGDNAIQTKQRSHQAAQCRADQTGKVVIQCIECIRGDKQFRFGE